MNSDRWLEWLKDDVFPKFHGGVLVIDRAPYHLVRTENTRPANTKMRKVEVAAWRRPHDCVPQEWESTLWEKNKVKKELFEQAAKNRPVPRYRVQDLAKYFWISIRISPVAHPELNPTEMVWGTVKMALRRANIYFTLTALKALAAEQFVNISAEECLKYELHAIKMEDNYLAVGEVSVAVEEAFGEEQPEVESRGEEGVIGSSGEESDVSSDMEE